MTHNLFKNFKKSISPVISVFFLLNMIMPPAYAQGILNLPAPGKMVTQSAIFTPPLMRGLIIDPENPFHFDFIIDTGDSPLESDGLQSESQKVIKYFLASLTIPEDDLWVNLSPYEKDRIIPNKFGETEMGRDLLAQDYLLKQLTASLIYPENAPGDKFWKAVHEKISAQYGTIDVPLDTFNKVWIVPESAVIYENQDTAYIQESRLDVMLEQDYLALEKNTLEGTQTDGNKLTAFQTEIMREIIIPEIKREINEGENFAQLRQVYHSLILAAWFKENLKNSILNKVYADQNKVHGVDVADKDIKMKIYQQYLEAFKKGAYDYIREDYDPATREIIPKRYFSGGVHFAEGINNKITRKPLSRNLSNIIKKGIKGAIILVTTLLINSAAAGNDANAIIQADPNSTNFLPVVEPGSRLFSSDSSLFTRAQPLTEEEKENIDAVAKERVEKYLQAIRDNTLTFSDSIVVTGLAASPYLLETILDDSESWNIRTKAMEVLARISVKKITPMLKAEIETPDPRIQSVIIPAALKILESINYSEIQGPAVEILESYDAQPTAETPNKKLYIKYLIITQRWDSLAETGEPAIEALMNAAQDSSRWRKNNIFKALSTIAADIADQDIVKNTIIPFLIDEAEKQDFVNNDNVITALGRIGASPKLINEDRVKIIEYLKNLSERSFQTTGSGMPLTALSKIAAAVQTQDPLKTQLTRLLLESSVDVDDELTEIAISLPDGNDLKEDIINKFKTSLTSERQYQRQNANKQLQIIKWQPASIQDRVIFFYAGNNWDALKDMGLDAVDPLMNLITDRSGKLDDNVVDTIFRIALNVHGDDLKNKIVEPALKILNKENIDQDFYADVLLSWAGYAAVRVNDTEYTKTRLLPLLFKLSGKETDMSRVCIQVLSSAGKQLANDAVFEEKILPMMTDHLLQSPDDVLRTAAADELTDILDETPANPQLTMKLINKLLTTLNSDETHYRDQSVRVLGKLAQLSGDKTLIIEDALPLILSNLNSTNIQDVKGAVEAIASITKTLGEDREEILKNHILPALSLIAKTDNTSTVEEALQAIGKNIPKDHSLKNLMSNLSHRTGEITAKTILLEDLTAIYTNITFKHLTKDMHPVNQFSVARAIEAILKQYDLDVTYGRISSLVPFVLKVRKDFMEETIFDNDHTIMMVLNNDQSIFFAPEIRDFFFGFMEIPDDVENYEKQVRGPFIGTLNDNKEKILNEITKINDNTVIYFNGHGSPKHFWLSNGYIGSEISDDLHNPNAISYKELATSLIDRAKSHEGSLSGITIFIDACFSSDFSIQVFNILNEHFQKGDIKSFPKIIAATNKGVVAYGTQTKNDLRITSVMMNGLIKASEDAEALKGEHIIQAETFEEVASLEDLSLFIPLTAEQQKELLDLLKISPTDQKKPFLIPFGGSDAASTTSHLNTMIPILSGLIGKKAVGKVVSNEKNDTKKLEIYDRTETFLGMRDLITIEDGQQRLATALNALKADRTNPQNAQILDIFLSLLENAPPEFTVFTDPVADFFGIADANSNLIALTRDLAQNNIALFHELGEFFIQQQTLRLSYDGKTLALSIGTEHAIQIELHEKAGSIADKGINLSDGIPGYNPHYLLRALQFQMFDEYDVRLTRTIKELQTERPAEMDKTVTGNTAIPKKYGGIDFNPTHLQIKRRGPGLKLNLPDELNPTELNDAAIEGLAPAILQMTPVYDLPALLSQ